MNEAILFSHAKIACVVNLMTKRGETTGFKASDFVRKIIDYLGDASLNLKYVFVNKKICRIK